MARRITVKRVLSGIPNISTLTTLTDINDSDLSSTNAYLKYDSDSGKFIFASLSSIISGVSTVNSLNGDVTIAGAGSVSVGTAGSTITITGTDTGVDSTAVNTLIAATDLGDLNNVATTSPSTGQVLKWNGSQWAPGTDNTGAGGDGGTDSAAVSALIDSALNVLDTHDSAAVLGQINNTVNKSFVDNLGVDAATLGGNDSSYYTNASNISTGTLSADRLPTITLGVNTTGNYVSDVSGTTNEIEVSASTGSVTIGLPSNVTIDSNLTVGGYIGGPAVFTIDPAAIGDSTGKVVILGDLQVDGTQTTINSTTVSISDKNIVLADSAADASQADGAGITVNGASATLQYASTGDKWVFNKAPYYNTNRLLTAADTLHDSNLVQGQIDSSLGVLDTHDSAAVLGQINATVDATFVRPLARAALVAGNNITYDSSTGVIASTAAGGTDSSTVVSIADSRIGVASIGDLSDVDLSNIQHNYVIKWDSDNNKFIGAVDVTTGGGGTDADTLDGQDGTYYLNYNNFTNTPTIPTLGNDYVDSAEVNLLINSTVNKSFVDNLGVDAATLGGNDSNYFTNAGNLTGTIDSGRIPTLVLGTDTTGNYVVDVSGTANQIEVSHTPSAGSTPVIGLPSNVTIDSNLTVGGYIAGPAVFTIDPAAIGDSTGKVVIFGDLQVDGVTTTINSTTVSISDKNIVLADSAADSSQANGAGITVNGANATIQYASTGDKWVFNKAPYYNTNRLLTAVDTLHDSNLVQGQIDSSFTNDTTFVRVAGDEVTGDINFGDNVKATFGNDSDFIIIHNGSHTVLKDQGTGSLYIEGSQIHLSSQNFGNPIFLTTGDNDGVKIFDSSGDLRLHSRDTGIYTYTGLFVDNNAVLTTASTIDADTLDTLQATSFLRSDQSDSMAGSLTIDDDLFVGGRIVSTSDSNISFGDNIILINTATTGNNTLDAGIEIERGLSTNVSFIWDESQDYWSFGTQNVHTTGVMYFANEFQDSTDLPDASIYHGMFAHDHNGDRAVYAHGTWHTLLDATYSTTDQLTEGATNKYYTQSKVDSDVGTIVNTAYVNALNVNADTVDSLQASQFLRSDSDDTMSANLTVTGTITTGSGSNTTIVDATDINQYSIKHTLVGVSVTTGNPTQISTFAHNSAAAAVEYVMQLQEATTNKTQVTKVLATYDGSEVAFTEYGVVHTGDSDLGTFAVVDDGTNIDLNFTRRGSNNVTVKIAKTVII